MISVRAALMTMAVILSVTHAYAENWFFSRALDKTCVPVEDLDTTNADQLLSDHTGILHTPHEVEAFFIALGARIDNEKEVRNGFPSGKTYAYVSFSVTVPGSITYLVLFNDETICNAIMR